MDERIKKFERFSQKDLEYLKNKLSSSVLNKKISYNHNLQIPIEFVKNNLNDNFDNTKEYNLNNFIKISKPPTLCLDLSDQSYELEIKLRELNEELNKKIKNKFKENKFNKEDNNPKDIKKDNTECKSINFDINKTEEISFSNNNIDNKNEEKLLNQKEEKTIKKIKKSMMN